MRFILPETMMVLFYGFILYNISPILINLDKQENMILFCLLFALIPICLLLYSLLSIISYLIKPEETAKGVIREIKVKSSTDEDGTTSYSYYLYLQDDKRKFNINYLKDRKKIYINYNPNQLMNPRINVKYKKILNRYIVIDVYVL